MVDVCITADLPNSAREEASSHGQPFINEETETEASGLGHMALSATLGTQAWVPGSLMETPFGNVGTNDLVGESLEGTVGM